MSKRKSLPTLSKGIVPQTDEFREQLISKKLRLDLLGCALTIVAGLGMVIVSLLSNSLHVSDGVELIILAPLFAAIIIMLIGTYSVGRYDLSPKDEFETLQALKARTTAFETLSSLIIMIVVFQVFLGDVSILGLVLLALGVARFTEWKSLRA